MREWQQENGSHSGVNYDGEGLRMTLTKLIEYYEDFLRFAESEDMNIGGYQFVLEEVLEQLQRLERLEK